MTGFRVLLLLSIVMAVGACSSGASTPAGTPTPEVDTEISLFIETAIPEVSDNPAPSNSQVPVATITSTGSASGPQIVFQNQNEQYLLFNQRIIEGLSAQDLDVHNVDEVFGYIFSRLPDEVTVYPSENYFYFVLYADGGQWWGNFRLPARTRADGDLSFAYFEFEDFPVGSRSGDTHAKMFNEPDGVFVHEQSRFVWEVEYQGKTVEFHFNELRQERPRSFALGPNEVFIQRTFDESGLQFFLIFNRDHNYFTWILNEEEIVPELITEFEDIPDIYIGRKSGFLFWNDVEHGNRKVLMAIRRASVQRNDYYDGPFDQLADNYAVETKVAEYMQRAYPDVRDNVDVYGYYLDREESLRVAISPYYTYGEHDDIHAYLALFEGATDPLDFISHGSALAGSGGALAQFEQDISTSTPVQ
ncbi:MAG: hypothetical protein HQ478_07530 [Chloroflexi bacterium]|nr:hypothetical protein [Chloroflexota bacterium]